MVQVLRRQSTSMATLPGTTAGTPLAWELTLRGSTGKNTLHSLTLCQVQTLVQCPVFLKSSKNNMCRADALQRQTALFMEAQGGREQGLAKCRYRQAELQNGRWAMLGVAGILAQEIVKPGVFFYNAGLPENLPNINFGGPDGKVRLNVFPSLCHLRLSYLEAYVLAQCNVRP